MNQINYFIRLRIDVVLTSLIVRTICSLLHFCVHFVNLIDLIDVLPRVVGSLIFGSPVKSQTRSGFYRIKTAGYGRR